MKFENGILCKTKNLSRHKLKFTRFVQLTRRSKSMLKSTQHPFLLLKPHTFELLNFYQNDRHNMAKDKSVTRLPKILPRKYNYLSGNNTN